MKAGLMSFENFLFPTRRGRISLAAPILALNDRPHGVIMSIRLSLGRIETAQAGILLLRRSFALVVEELAISAGAGCHGILPVLVRMSRGLRRAWKR